MFFNGIQIAGVTALKALFIASVIVVAQIDVAPAFWAELMG
jgi:hypothetical protein